MEPTTPEEKLVRENLRTASEKIDSPEGLLSLTQAEIGALNKSTFSDIGKPAAELAELGKKADDLARNPNSAESKLAFQENLKKFSDTRGWALSPESVDTMIRSVTTEGSSALGRLSQEVTTEFAAKTLTTGATGGMGAATQTGTAMEAYNVQTNINRAIQTALEIVATQLGAKPR